MFIYDCFFFLSLTVATSQNVQKESGLTWIRISPQSCVWAKANYSSVQCCRLLSFIIWSSLHRCIICNCCVSNVETSNEFWRTWNSQVDSLCWHLFLLSQSQLMTFISANCAALPSRNWAPKPWVRRAVEKWALLSQLHEHQVRCLLRPCLRPQQSGPNMAGGSPQHGPRWREPKQPGAGLWYSHVKMKPTWKLVLL